MKPLDLARFGSCVAALMLSAALPSSAAQYDCVIDPSQTVDVAGASGGIVSEVFVEAGDSVSQNQIIARLDSTLQAAAVDILELRANDSSDIDAQRTQLLFLEGRLERTLELSTRGVVTREMLEEIQSSVDASRAILTRAQIAQKIAQQELVRARAALSLLEIRTPINGIVFERFFDKGEYLPQEGRIATIVRLDPLEVISYLPVSRYGSIAEGDIGTIQPNPPLTGEYGATITRIDRVFDVASGTFSIRLRLDNPGFMIPAGHRCIVELEEGTEAKSP